MRVAETYTNGRYFTRVCMLTDKNERVEYTVNEFTLHVKAYDFPKSHVSMGRDIEVDESALEIVKSEYNKFWTQFNKEHPKHARKLF